MKAGGVDYHEVRRTNIRAVTLEGSRTNVNIPPDDFQDYDITFFVTDIQ